MTKGFVCLLDDAFMGNPTGKRKPIFVGGGPVFGKHRIVSKLDAGLWGVVENTAT